MKEIINYYYNFDLVDINEFNNYASFNYQGEDFYFVFFNRTEEELKDLLDIIYELKMKGLRVHDIIINRYNSPLTKVGDNNYLLLKLNSSKNEKINLVCVNF